MLPVVKTKLQANFKDFKRFGAFKGLVEQKNVVFNSFACKLGPFWHSWAFKMAHACQKRANLHTNSSNKLLLIHKNVLQAEKRWVLNITWHEIFFRLDDDPHAGALQISN
jgi:hypothetical protein